MITEIFVPNNNEQKILEELSETKKELSKVKNELTEMKNELTERSVRSIRSIRSISKSPQNQTEKDGNILLIDKHFINNIINLEKVLKTQEIEQEIVFFTRSSSEIDLKKFFLEKKLDVIIKNNLKDLNFKDSKKYFIIIDSSFYKTFEKFVEFTKYLKSKFKTSYFNWIIIFNENKEEKSLVFGLIEKFFLFLGSNTNIVMTNKELLKKFEKMNFLKKVRQKL